MPYGALFSGHIRVLNVGTAFSENSRSSLFNGINIVVNHISDHRFPVYARRICFSVEDDTVLEGTAKFGETSPRYLVGVHAKLTDVVILYPKAFTGRHQTLADQRPPLYRQEKSVAMTTLFGQLVSSGSRMSETGSNPCDDVRWTSCDHIPPAWSSPYTAKPQSCLVRCVISACTGSCVF